MFLILFLGEPGLHHMLFVTAKNKKASRSYSPMVVNIHEVSMTLVMVEEFCTRRES